MDKKGENGRVALKISKEDIISILDRNTAWIENCDSKASIILGFFGVLLTVFFVSDFVSEINVLLRNLIESHSLYAGIFIIFMIISTCTMTLGCFFLTKSLYAKTIPRDLTISKKKLSSIFFTDISKRIDANAYESDILNMCEEDLSLI